MRCGKQIFFILKPYRRWSPMIADAPKTQVFINRNSSAMDRRLSARNYDLMKTRLKLEPELRLAPSVAVFKKKLLSEIRPLAKFALVIHDPKGLSYFTQLRVGLSNVNFHIFQHDFRDTINPMCSTSDGIEDTEPFLLICPSF